MDFSSNGKFLASCADEDTEELDPGGECSGQSSSSEGNKENSPQGSTPRGCKGALLSRRQKKNRIRRDDGSPVARNNSNMKKSKTRGKRSDGKKVNASIPALRQHAKLNLADSDLCVFLRHYVLSPDQLLGLGYPVESALYPGRAIIYRSPAAGTQPSSSLPSMTTSSHFFDVNAQEFIPMSAKKYNNGVLLDSDTNVHISNLIDDNRPGMDYSEISAEWSADHKSEVSATGDGDSGTTSSGCEEGSTSSSSPEISTESDVCEFNDVMTVEEEVVLEVVEKSEAPDLSADLSTSESRERERSWCSSDEKKCVRCGRGFFVTTDGEYLTQEHCLYHWGKLQKVVIPSAKGSGMTARTEYSCCRGRASTRGCTTGKLHVWNGVGLGINGPFDGYVRTRARKTPPLDGNFGVYALDCEMCFTTRGLELTKVTVVATDGRLVYDCLVKPENYIIDYNTRFSGITARDLAKKGTKSLKDVQNDLMGFINADTILVGHGLENDLRALRIIHGTVIDTSVVFPHYYGLPYRRSLKSLVGCLLKRDIQKDSSGHDSFEDARACIELMLWRVRKDFRTILEN
ncbi:putative exonuclease GOR isoform X2 [Anabrus simplex]